MATHDISFHCKDCGQDHPVLSRVDVSGGPESKGSVAEIFQGRSIPPQIQAIRGREAFCYKTGRKFKLDKDDDIFLVPPTNFLR